MDGKLLRPLNVVIGLGVLGAASLWGYEQWDGEHSAYQASERVASKTSSPLLPTTGEDAVPDASTAGVNPIVLGAQGVFSSEPRDETRVLAQKSSGEHEIPQGKLAALAILPRGIRLTKDQVWEVGFDIVGRMDRRGKPTRGLVWGFARFKDPSGALHEVASHPGLDPELPFVNEVQEHAVSFQTRSRVHKVLHFQVPSSETWSLERVKLIVHERGSEPIAAYLPMNGVRNISLR